MITFRSELLIVAGPSGCGKSTFMEQLSSGRLGGDIQDRLPDDCSGWMQLTRLDYLKRGFHDAERAPPNGVLLHYDISRVWRRGLNGYESDPVFASPFRADRVVLVNIRVSAQTLARHLEQRHAARELKRTFLHSAWHQFVRRPLQLAFGANHDAYAYWDQSRLDEYYVRWDDFAKTRILNCVDALAIDVEPAPENRLGPSFRLCACAAPSDAGL